MIKTVGSIFENIFILFASYNNTMTRSGNESKENCEHFAGIDENKVSPRTQGCEECEKEGSEWVALRMCLECGHVGCCDSSVGLHATKHFNQTGHPVMIALPNKPWKWCYIHKQYY
jgi:uncharacterized UBP type Zn finger protein